MRIYIEALIRLYFIEITQRSLALTYAGPGGGRFYATPQAFVDSRKQIWHSLSDIFSAHFVKISTKGHLRSGHQGRIQKNSKGRVMNRSGAPYICPKFKNSTDFGHFISVVPLFQFFLILFCFCPNRGAMFPWKGLWYP